MAFWSDPENQACFHFLTKFHDKGKFWIKVDTQFSNTDGFAVSPYPAGKFVYKYEMSFSLSERLRPFAQWLRRIEWFDVSPTFDRNGPVASMNGSLIW
jgi:hypothetical protein